MVKNTRFFILGLLVLGVIFSSGCGSQGGDFSVHSSTDGFVPEAFVPADAGLVISYSLRDADQFAAVAALEAALGDSGRTSRTVSDSFNNQFENVDLDYETDLKPAFGERFRLLFAARTTGSKEEADAFTISTLEDPDKMTDVLETLVSAGELTYKKLSSVDAYVSEEENFYASVYEDLILVANTPDALVEMLTQDENESLWELEEYQNSLANFGPDYVFYGVAFPGALSGVPAEGLDITSQLGGIGASSLVDSQSIVIRAVEDGLDFDVFATANEAEAKKSEFSFADAPKSKPYLFEEVPAENLMVYVESYGLRHTVDQKRALGEDNMTGVSDFFRSYFAMDFDEDVLSFLGKGYALAVHKNNYSAFPGLTIFVDTSDGGDTAEEFVTKLDEQMATLLFMLDSIFPGAVSKGTTEIEGEIFDTLNLDFGAAGQESDGFAISLPEILASSSIRLAYGMLGDRLLITTAEAWGKGGVSVKDSDLYNSLSEKLVDVNQGLVLVDARAVAEFSGNLRALREELGLGVSDSILDFEGILEGFLGAVLSSRAEDYQNHFGGFLMIAE